jgi:hypothetical protein
MRVLFSYGFHKYVNKTAAGVRQKQVINPIALLFLMLCPVCAWNQSTLSKAELRKSVAAAKAPEEHERLASYFRDVARSYLRQEQEEDQIATRWKKQYENWTKTPNPYRSAVNLAGYYRQLANDATAHARQQERLAAAAAAAGH